MPNDGTPASESSQPVAATGQPDSTVSSNPSPIELSDDALVRIPGSDKPVKYGEWYRGLQGKLTTTAQERARLAKEYAQLKQERETEAAELRRFREAAGHREQPKPPSIGEKFKELPYLKGQEAADALSQLEARFGQYDQALSVRDQAIRLLAERLSEQMKTVGTITQREAEAQRKAKIREVMKSIDLPEEAEEMALDIWHSYEGDGLEDQFPELLKARWELAQKLVRAADRKRVQTARTKFVPGKGGEARPGGQLDLSRASAKDTADALWESMVGGDAPDS